MAIVVKISSDYLRKVYPMASNLKNPIKLLSIEPFNNTKVHVIVIRRIRRVTHTTHVISIHRANQLLEYLITNHWPIKDMYWFATGLLITFVNPLIEVK